MRLLIAIFVIIFLLTFVFAAVTQNNHFSVVPEILRLNWTNNYSSDVYLFFNKTNLTVEVLNTTPFQSFYYQQNTLTKCQYNSQGYMLSIIDKNASSYNNTFNYSSGSNVTVSLIDLNHLDCRPGRYYASIAFVDMYNTTEKANVTVFVDIPISQHNNPLISSGVASFDGSMQQGNQSFYFNSSLVANATGVLINITPMKPFGVFLFEDQKLKAKSAGEELVSKVEENKIYEIRVSGNQSYFGNLVFTGLNASIERINFGTLNVTQSNSTTFRLENNFDIEEQQIMQSIILYHVDEFSSNAAKNFTFFVPQNVSSIKAVMNWSGNAGYAVNLYYNGVLQASSSSVQNLFKNASVSPEEHAYLTNPAPGIWTVEVKNLTQPDSYSLKVYQSISPFVSTNFTSQSLSKGNSIEVNATLSIPLSAWDGKYEGYIKYNSSRGGGILLPISFNVTSSLLLINNSVSFSSIQLTENYGKNASYEFLLPLNNTGTYPVALSFLSSGKLYNSNYTINITTPSSMVLQQKSHGLASINFTFNSSAPKGTYIGWMMINTTGDEEERSHPNNAYNISIQFVLTDELRVDLLEIKTASGSQTINNASKDENVTARFRVFYINGTEIEAGNQLNTTNFQVWLEHANLSYRVPSSGSLILFNATNPIYLGGDYEINFTIPAGKLGGKYNVRLKADWQKDQANYTGTGYNSTLIINSTALMMQTPNSTSISLEPSKSITFVVQVINYGERNTQTYTLKMNESCSGYSVSASSLSNCSGSMSGDTFTISSINAYSSCQFAWTIQAGSSNASACIAYVIASPSEGWYDPAAINVSVVVRTQQSLSATTTTIEQQELIPQEEEVKYFSVESDTKISVEQGKNKTLNVKVKNLYNTRQTIKLSLSSINSSWFIISPAENAIAKGDYYIYRVIFTIPKDAPIGDYKGKIKIESSHHSEEVPITLTVLPGDELKNLINTTINAYDAKLNELLSKFNSTQNETIRSKLEEIKSKVNELKSYLAKNDYSAAYSKLYDVKKLFDEMQNFEETREEAKEIPRANFNWPLMLIASSGVLFASVLGYTAFETMKKKGFSFNVKSKPKVDTKKELLEIKQNFKLKELEEEIKVVKEREKELEEEIKRIEEKEKEIEKN
jgi:hypothetical protein